MIILMSLVLMLHRAIKHSGYRLELYDVRLFFLARYDIPFWSLRTQQNLVLCAKPPKSTGVQNTSVEKNNTRFDHGTDSEATPAYRLQALPPSNAVDGSNMRPNQPTTFWQNVTPAPVPTL
jgi:hypothetical protein